jgi:hypothetical protein
VTATRRGPVTFVKLDDGTWGVSGPAQFVRPGSTLTVTTYEGKTRTITIGEIVFRRDDYRRARFTPARPRTSHF